MKVFKNRALRWALLMVGLIAIIALTGMNVLSLYDLRDKMVESEEERRIDQLSQIESAIWNEIRQPLRGLYKLELEPIETFVQEQGKFPDQVQELLERASQSTYFEGIYYTPEHVDPCVDAAAIYRLNKESLNLEKTTDFPPLVCDGVGLVRTKTKIQLNDFNYRWNNNVEFDTHRSFNIGLINLNESRIIGYLTITLNDDIIVNDLIKPLITDFFETSDKSGIVVWLHDRTNDEVLATNDPGIPYERDLVDHRHNFSEFFDNWSLRLTILQAPIKNAYNTSLNKNLVVLGVAVLFLLGALIFMFVTAQRERNLAQRQASFLANVTHELKTPLAVMQAAGENISDGRVTEPDRLRQYGEHIYNESIRLRGMIEKLLDVARVDSGQTMIKAAPYCIHDMVQEYLRGNKDYIENKGFEVSYNAKDKVSATLIDRESFETILNNLTENAIKYSTDQKSIKYQVSADDDSVYFSITDKGIGIPKKDQKNIFKKFFRVEDSDSTSNKVKGHGLGLSIVKNMVELNGGSIDVKSKLGSGTTFILRFPKLVKEDLARNQVQTIRSSDETLIKTETEYAG